MNSRSEMRRLAAVSPGKLIEEIERLRKESSELLTTAAIYGHRAADLTDLLRAARGCLNSWVELGDGIQKLGMGHPWFGQARLMVERIDAILGEK